ncbi:MAG: response regulator [Desulfosarcinaceae bacterium]|nr:response regulator [Desulfosarcinaceae bacterium]
MDPSEWLVLLIDDEVDIREVTRLALQDAGYSVICAADGQAGVALCDSHHPQLIITDIRMPVMDGLAVLERVKRTHPQTEVVVVTAFAEISLAVRALQLDASDFITKPINASALLVALERACERYRSRQKLREYTAFLASGWAGASQALKVAYDYQTRLIENSLDGILGCDAAGRLVMVNRSLEQLLGRTRDLLVGHCRFQDLLSAEEYARFQHALGQVDLGGAGRLPLFETRLAATASEIPVQLSAVQLIEADQPVGLVCFVRDLRALRRLEREMADHARLLHQDKMMALGRLAASVAHEINNPLAGVLNYLKLMAHITSEGKGNSETLKRFDNYLDLVINETQRCSKIVSNLLAFSRKSALVREPVDLSEMLSRCVLLSQHKLELHAIQLHCRWDAQLPTVEGDTNQLQQCVVNLVFNAIDAMPDGGDLFLSAAHRKAEQAVVIEVRDTGRGIDPTNRPLIFEPFFTTKQEGAGVGLGLSTSFGIIERHRGRLSVEESGPEGTTFRIWLPVMLTAADREASP